ncbi:MAG: GAF domain-containing protein, partial [Treponema sp.]|nr:GAF domain-containing protein [Treponema sp.]
MDWFPEFLTINVVGFLLTFATGFIVTVVVLMRHLDRLRVWIFGIVAHLLAFGVLLLQPSLPLPLFVLLFNGLQIFALCAYIATTLFLLGGDIRRPLFIAIQAVIVGFAVILSFITPDRWIRVVLMSVAFAGLLVYGVILILKGARAAKIRNGPIILISMFVIGSFLYLLRAFVYLFPPHPWGLGDIETESLMTLAGIVLYTSINYALLVILMARVERELTGKVIELGDSRNTLQILYDAFSETAGSVDLDELLPRILDILQRNLHVDVTIIYIKDGKSDDLQLVAQRGLSAEALDAVIHHERGSILSEQASLQGTTAHRRIEEYPEGRLKDALKGLGLASFAAFPIIDRGQSLGSLGVAFKDETALDEARSSLFETMARQLGSIVRAAMLHAELERANARLDILASTDALTHLPNRRTALRVLEREI